jgi:hypothetical protein
VRILKCALTGICAVFLALLITSLIWLIVALWRFARGGTDVFGFFHGIQAWQVIRSSLITFFSGLIYRWAKTSPG